MSSLNIESLTKEVIREIVLERFFGTQNLSKFVSEVNLSELLGSSKPVSTPKSNELVWESSYRRDLMEIPVGTVRYFSRPRNMDRTKHRARYGRARYSLRKFYGADFEISRTETGLKIKRVA